MHIENNVDRAHMHSEKEIMLGPDETVQLPNASPRLALTVSFNSPVNWRY